MTDATMPVVFILGQGHSGSTLLDSMLDSHSAIVGVGELFRYRRAVELDEECTCGKKVRACPFWTAAFDGLSPEKLPLLHRRGADFFRNRGRYIHSPGAKPEPVDPEAYRAFNRALFSRILSVSGKRIICDSSKSPDRAAVLMDDPALDVRILHLVRDGRGVAYSYMKKNRGGFYALRFMREWMFSNLKVEALRRRHPDAPYLLIRYDDIVSDTEGTLRRIAAFLGVPFESAMRSFGGFEHHQIGGNRRFRRRGSDDIQADESWRDGLGFFPKLLFAVLFSWMNRRYGIGL